MANICLPQTETDEFKRALKDGRIDPEALSKMTSEERHNYLADIVGEDYATLVNAEFEKNLLLKNQQKGMIEWAKNVAGLKPEVRTDIIDKINKLDHVLSPKEGEAFLSDLAEQKLGIGVTREEAKTIVELSKKIDEMKAFNGVKSTEDLVQMLDLLPKDTMTEEQKTSLESLKSKFEEIKNSQAIEEAKVKAEKDARKKIETDARAKLKEEADTKRKELSDQKKAAKTKASEKAKAERDALREETKQKKLEAKQDAQSEKMIADFETKRQREIADREFKIQDEIDRQYAKEERTIKRQEEKDQREFDRKSRKDEETFVRQTEQARKKAERDNFKTAIGENLRKVKKAFGDQIPEEVKTRMDNVAELRAGIQSPQDQAAYGKAREELEHYVSGITSKTFAQQFKENKFQTIVQTIAGLTKSNKASLDNSAIFRQGWKALFTHPKQWIGASADSFLDFAKTLSGKDTLRVVRAEILGDPNYEKMRQAKLAVGTREEDFPSSLLGKIPGVGRLYNASEAAFTGFVHRLRADIFNKYLDIAEKAGVDINDKYQLESIGKLVNSLTGRGHLGALEPAANFVNNAFFSPRNIKATIDTLTLHSTDKISGFARKQAAYNLLKVVGGIAAIIGIANAISPGSAETDPRSSNFGKIKVGNTRFDISGGMSSLVTLASRILPVLTPGVKAYTKNSSNGKLVEINSGKFGAQTGLDVLYEYLQNKASPIGSVLIDLLRGEDFNFQKPTFGGEAKNLLLPLGVQNYIELKNDPRSANIIAAMLADSLGIATNTYGAAKKKK